MLKATENSKITEKFLNDLPKWTSIGITAVINGKSEIVDLITKDQKKDWVENPGGAKITPSNLVKYLKMYLEDPSVTVTIDPNEHSDGDKPVYVFENDDNWTINNTRFLKGGKTCAPKRKNTRKSGIKSLENAYKRML